MAGNLLGRIFAHFLSKCSLLRVLGAEKSTHITPGRCLTFWYHYGLEQHFSTTLTLADFLGTHALMFPTVEMGSAPKEVLMSGLGSVIFCHDCLSV